MAKSIKNILGGIKGLFAGKHGQHIHAGDWYLIGAIWFLVIFGLIMMSSAGVAVGLQKYNDAYYHVKHQFMVGVIPGFCAFVFFYFFDYRKLERYAGMMFFVSIALLMLVYVPGLSANWGTAKSWINVFGYSLQPSEIVKITYLIYLSAWLAQKEKHHVADISLGFLPFVISFSIIVLLNMQDTGTMIILVAMSLAVYFSAGGRLLHLSLLGGAGLAGLLALVKISPYRAARLTTFLHPELDPKGIGYHINQALLAVGSGGIFGRGYGHSRQKFNYLPETTSDSIFAVTAEELGLFFSALVVATYAFIAVRGLKLAATCQDNFGRYLVVGFITWLTVQAFVNIAAILGMMPLTGVPLPFISYGGTAMLSGLAAAGILANISRQNARRS